MPDAPWKATEREIARALGARRNPNTGEFRADINAGPWCIESKKRKTLPAWLTGAMRQAVRAAVEGETPLVVLTEVSRGRKAERLVLMRWDDWLAWHGQG